MATDATGSPTSKFSIPKFNVNTDAPSGLGGNAQMDSIDALIASLGIAGLVANDVPVYDSVAGKFKKATGTPSTTTFLRGDGSWQAVTPAVTPALVKLGETSITANAPGIEVTGIAAGYRNLLITLACQGGDQASFQNSILRLNGDTSASYRWLRQYTLAATASTDADAGPTATAIFGHLGRSAGANNSNMWARIFNYASTGAGKAWQGGFFMLDGGNYSEGTMGGSWNQSTLAVTTVRIQAASGNILASSGYPAILTVYGEA